MASHRWDVIEIASGGPRESGGHVGGSNGDQFPVTGEPEREYRRQGHQLAMPDAISKPSTSTTLPMSYAGPTPRSHGHDKPGYTPAGSPGSSPRPLAGSYGARRMESSAGDSGRERSWQHLAIFGAGLALGIAVGAGAALLTAPRTGAETRAVLASRVGRARRATSRRGRDAWDDLRDELRSARRALKRRKMQRALERESEI
jgi:hypothetical protein